MPNYFQALAMPFRGVQRAAVLAILAVIAIVFASLLLNVFGGAAGMGIVSMIAFFCLVFFLICAYGPAHLIATGFLGVLYSAINRQVTTTAGVSAAFKLHAEIVTLLALVFVGAEFVLATIPFRNDPFGFFYIMMGVILIILIMKYFKIPTEKLIPLCSIVFIGLLLAGRVILTVLGVEVQPNALMQHLPTWQAALAVLAGVALLGLLIFNKGFQGWAGKNLGTLTAIGVLALAGYWGYTHFFSASATAGQCSQARMIVDPGALITMPSNCPVYVDQVRWQNGVTWKAAKLEIRRLIGDRDQELVSHARLYDQTHKEKDRHILVLTPNPRAFERYGFDSIELIFYPAGTAPPMTSPVTMAASTPAAGLDWLKPKQ